MFENETEIVDGEVVDHSHDKVFFFTFGGVLAFLFALTFILIVIANTIDDDPEGGMHPVVRDRVAANTAPVGGVYTDASAIPVSAPPKPAEPRSGEQIVSSVCAACHQAGVLGAMKFDDTAGWKARLDAAGMDGLFDAAWGGKGSMPPKGGDASLTKAELRDAIAVMLKTAGL